MKKSDSHSIHSIDFDTRQLEIFRKVVELQSFSKAAEAVFLAQASVSERIANLENMVGTRLLDRLGRQVVPTKAGELLYKHAVSLLDMKKMACLEMEEFLGIQRGEIHMGGSTIPGNYILPKLIGRFHQEYPLVSVNLSIADTKEIENRVSEGDLELGVVGSKSSRKSLIQHHLWKDELVVAVNAGHRWAGKREIPFEALSEEPFILRQTGSGTLKMIEEYLHISDFKDKHPLTVVAHLGTSTAVKEGIKAGLGVSILSSRAIESEVKAKELRSLRIKGTPMHRNFYLIRDRRRIASPLCQAMLHFLSTTAEE